MDNSSIIISIVIVLCIAAGVTAYGLTNDSNTVFNDLSGFTPDEQGNTGIGNNSTGLEGADSGTGTGTSSSSGTGSSSSSSSSSSSEKHNVSPEKAKKIDPLGLSVLPAPVLHPCSGYLPSPLWTYPQMC